MGGRGLAVGAGDGGDGRGLRAGERRGHQRERAARIGVAQHGDAGIERRQRGVGRREDATAAPRSTASATKRAPSALAPGSAANRKPGWTSREVGGQAGDRADRDRAARRCAA